MPVSESTSGPTSPAVNSATAGPSNRNSWFDDLRAKLNQFSEFRATDIFPFFGFASKNQTGNDLRKASQGNPASTSRSVMDLSTRIDDHPKMESNGKSNANPTKDIATSGRHHSEEPRRRLLVTKSSAGEPEEEHGPKPGLRQQSEPPDMWSTNDVEHGRNHDDDEQPISLTVGHPDVTTEICDAQRFGTITGLVPTGKRDVGVGHSFERTPAGYPTWCDKCGDFISGLLEGQAVRCRNCRFTCHVHCQPLVTLDCRSSSNSLKSENSSATEGPDTGVESTVTSSVDDKGKQSESDYRSLPGTEITELNDFDVEDAVNVALEEISDELQRDLPQGDKLSRLIDEYNRETADGLAMTLEEDGITFHGFLQIHMNFNRPINVIAGEHPPTIFDVLVSENDQDDQTISSDGRKTITSFYLPRNTVKVLHITSETTTSEMIVSLLKKFKVADNPRKFALYERDLEPGETLQARLLRIPEEACPLRLALFRGCKKRTTRFVLQENETGDIMWEAFEIPELQNFLKILDIEESQYIKQIEQRYYVYRYWLEAEIRHRLATRASEKRSVASDNVLNRGMLDLEDENAVEV